MQRGGSGTLGTELVSGLAGAGHRVRVLTSVPAGSPALRDRFETEHPGIETWWFSIPIASSDLLDGSRNPGYRAAEDGAIRAEFPRMLAERRPDVIMIGRESVVAEVPPIARRHGIPAVALVQGGRALAGMLASNPDRLARHQRERLRQVDAVIAIAHHLERALIPLGLPRVTVIPNPVHLDRFAPGGRPPELARALGIRPDDVVVAHVSNLGPLKRPLDVIESAGRALAVDPRLVYLVVGDGPYRAPMEACARALGIAARVRFVGWVEHRDVPAYLRLADVVVMPSEREGLALVYLEAQAVGRVLVASDIPAAREVVVDGVTGLLARPGEIDDLAAKTLRAAGDPALREAIGRAARTAVQAHATPRILAEYARVLAGVVRDRRAGSPGAERDPGGARDPRADRGPRTDRDPAAAGSAGATRRSSVPRRTRAASLAGRLGPDLWALVQAQGGRLIRATPVGTLASPLRTRAAFRLELADGRVLKGRRVDDEASAARVERLWPLLDPRHFPRLLGRRGVALLSEWVDGVPVRESPDARPDLCRQAGALHGALHRTATPPDEQAAALLRWKGGAARLRRELEMLVVAGRLDAATAARARTAVTDERPDGVELGLGHGDLCAENLVVAGGLIRVVDTEGLRVAPADHDLARTWYRWPMIGAEWQAYCEGYRRFRGMHAFRRHFVHWAVTVLVESAAFRLRARIAGADRPLIRLRALLAAPAEAPPAARAARG
ncbi:MAG TPA: glycosyltransferase [Methylomirabilota bacterium]|nr:glycosyltransferase [Methylomirabilota bacterium]